MNLVIDTNVPVAANGRNTHANNLCQYRCIEFLQEVTSGNSNHVTVLDKMGLLLKEYSGYLNFHGQLGVGDLFYKFLHDNMYTYTRHLVQLVPITPSDDEARGFDELPANNLDPSDRKFLATAVASGAAVINALDTDWHEQRTFFVRLNVAVRQLCPEHACVEA